MKSFIELSREATTIHNKLDAFVKLHAEIVGEEYTTISQVLGSINSKIDDILLDSKAIVEQMEAVVNE